MSSKVTLVLLGVVLGIGHAVRAGQCTCSVANIQDGWCSDCKLGYFVVVKISSRALFDALTGKDVKPEEVKCASCQAALEVSGFCSQCRLGFVEKKQYASRIAYLFAKGERKEPSGIKCVSCQKHAADHGWCDSCKVGMVGKAAFKDMKAYDEAVEARPIVTAAAESKCEQCAVAMVTDGECKECKVTYKDGKTTKLEKP